MSAWNACWSLPQLCTCTSMESSSPTTWSSLSFSQILLSSSQQVPSPWLFRRDSFGPNTFSIHIVFVMLLISDDVIINSIVGTGEGRIFMGGSDCCVYEIRYQVRTLSPTIPLEYHLHSPQGPGLVLAAQQDQPQPLPRLVSRPVCRPSSCGPS